MAFERELPLPIRSARAATQVTVSGETLASFGLAGPAIPLPGGEGRSFRVGEVVLRRENIDEVAEAAWRAELFAGIVTRDFRIPRPVRTAAGGWIAPGGWTAWTFVEGRPATRADAPAVAHAADAFHAALAAIPQPPHLAQRDTLYDRSDRWAWGEPPAQIGEPFAGLVARLAAVRRPLTHLPAQLIHGDLNPDNFLVAPGQPPAIIDMAAYWRPASFGAAVAAYWLGPYRADASVLDGFAQVPHLDQLLVRAGLRMLLSAWQFDDRQEIDRHRMATEMIVRRCL
jgi:uncharacterized protein (TIGR02569 family)